MRRKDRTVKLFPFAQYPLLFGHRGCSKLAPENTLASFQQILDHNVPGVELDVQMCSTGEIIVLHDLNLKRTTGLDSLASETELAEIKKLDTALIYTKRKDFSWYLHNGGGKYICKPNILKPTRRKVNLYTMFLNKNIQGYKIITWTVDNLLKAEKYIDLGVDGIITNIPENMIELFHKKWDMYESLKHDSTLRSGQ